MSADGMYGCSGYDRHTYLFRTGGVVVHLPCEHLVANGGVEIFLSSVEKVTDWRGERLITESEREEIRTLLPQMMPLMEMYPIIG